MKKRRLKSLDDLRRYLAWTLNQLESGEIDDARAKTAAYCTNIMAGIIRDSDLEARIAALEENKGGGK